MNLTNYDPRALDVVALLSLDWRSQVEPRQTPSLLPRGSPRLGGRAQMWCRGPVRRRQPEGGLWLPPPCDCERAAFDPAEQQEAGLRGVMSVRRLVVSRQIKECGVTVEGIQESRCRDVRCCKDGVFCMWAMAGPASVQLYNSRNSLSFCTWIREGSLPRSVSLATLSGCL